MYYHSRFLGCERIISQLPCCTAQYYRFTGIRPPVRLWQVQNRSRQTPDEQPIHYIISVRSLMQDIVTLAPLVVKESHLNRLALQPNIQDVQAAELKSGG
jgi:hypothetical protein